MNRRLLIIDDEEDIREVARMAIEATTTWTVETAPDGPHGVQAAARAAPDAILLDYMMPGMDGLTTLQELRAHDETRHVAVVFLTAKVETGLAERLARAGAVGHITKPFEPMTLAGRLTKILGWANGHA